MKEGTVDTSDLETDNLIPTSTLVRLEFSEAQTTESDESISVSILLNEAEILSILDDSLGIYAETRIIGNCVDGGGRTEGSMEMKMRELMTEPLSKKGKDVEVKIFAKQL